MSLFAQEKEKKTSMSLYDSRRFNQIKRGNMNGLKKRDDNKCNLKTQKENIKYLVNCVTLWAFVNSKRKKKKNNHNHPCCQG